MMRFCDVPDTHVDAVRGMLALPIYKKAVELLNQPRLMQRDFLDKLPESIRQDVRAEAIRIMDARK